MKYPKAITRPYTSAQARDRAALVEAARRAIPINTYLKMLNHVILTGEYPKVDPLTGDFTGQFDQVSTDQRIETTKYLLDMAVPQLQRVTPAEDDGLKHATVNGKSLTADDVTSLDSNMLRALLAANDAAIKKVTNPDDTP